MSHPVPPCIALIGATGQVGQELSYSLASLGDLHALPRASFDLETARADQEAIRSLQPDLLVNAGGYTDVDGAESNRASADRINVDGTATIAQLAATLRIPLVHFSTDYVFGGEIERPYRPSDPTGPINAYGESKLRGEQAIRRAGCAHLIIRTSWVYSLFGRNFLLTMLRIGMTEPVVRVVDDQIGCPTWSRLVAQGAAEMIAVAWNIDDGSFGARGGTHHLTCQDQTTWFGFARAIFERAGLPARLEPITTSDYPTPARRPRYSVLDCTSTVEQFGVRLPHWATALDACLTELPASSTLRGEDS